jgi:hypothetical protein
MPETTSAMLELLRVVSSPTLDTPQNLPLPQAPPQEPRRAYQHPSTYRPVPVQLQLTPHPLLNPVALHNPERKHTSPLNYRPVPVHEKPSEAVIPPGALKTKKSSKNGEERKVYPLAICTHGKRKGTS